MHSVGAWLEIRCVRWGHDKRKLISTRNQWWDKGQFRRKILCVWSMHSTQNKKQTEVHAPGTFFTFLFTSFFYEFEFLKHLIIMCRCCVNPLDQYWCEASMYFARWQMMHEPFRVNLGWKSFTHCHYLNRTGCGQTIRATHAAKWPTLRDCRTGEDFIARPVCEEDGGGCWVGHNG